MNHRIIAISRQFGSGGRTIGKVLAKELGIPCYDQELITMFAKESGFSEEYIKEDSEQTRGGLFSGIFSDRVYDTPITQDILWETQKKVILQLAKKESCVIVGRCADHILKDANCLRVYIHADKEKRAERIVRLYGETEHPISTRIAEKDRSRKAYYQKYTGTAFGSAENYHIALDSGGLGLDQCVRLIRSLY